MTDWYVEKYTKRLPVNFAQNKYGKHKTTMFLCSACDMERMDFVAIPNKCFWLFGNAILSSF